MKIHFVGIGFLIVTLQMPLAHAQVGSGLGIGGRAWQNTVGNPAPVKRSWDDAVAAPEALSPRVNAVIQRMAIVYSRWNPRYSESQLNQILMSRVQSQGLVNGLIKPGLALMDVSTISRRPEIGSLMAPLMAQLSPRVSNELQHDYGIALPPSGNVAFYDTSTSGVATFRYRVNALLGPISLSGSSAPSRGGTPAGDPMEQVTFGQGSMLQSSRQAHQDTGRGAFSGRSSADINACMGSCLSNAAPTIAEVKKYSESVGGKVGGVVGAMVGVAAGLGPVGATAAGAPFEMIGEEIGGRAGEGIAKLYYVDSCAESCGGKPSTSGPSAPSSPTTPSTPSTSSGGDDGPSDPSEPPDHGDDDDGRVAPDYDGVSRGKIRDSGNPVPHDAEDPVDQCLGLPRPGYGATDPVRPDDARLIDAATSYGRPHKPGYGATDPVRPGDGIYGVDPDHSGGPVRLPGYGSTDPAGPGRWMRSAPNPAIAR